MPVLVPEGLVAVPVPVPVPVPLSFFARSWKAWKLRSDDSSELIALGEKGDEYRRASVLIGKLTRPFLDRSGFLACSMPK